MYTNEKTKKESCRACNGIGELSIRAVSPHDLKRRGKYGQRTCQMCKGKGTVKRDDRGNLWAN